MDDNRVYGVNLGGGALCRLLVFLANVLGVILPWVPVTSISGPVLFVLLEHFPVSFNALMAGRCCCPCGCG